MPLVGLLYAGLALIFGAGAVHLYKSSKQKDEDNGQDENGPGKGQEESCGEVYESAVETRQGYGLSNGDGGSGRESETHDGAADLEAAPGFGEYEASSGEPSDIDADSNGSDTRGVGIDIPVE